MIRQFLQLLGAISLTAGAVLFFTSDGIVTTPAATANQEDEISRLTQELSEVKEALADAQHAKPADQKEEAESNDSEASAESQTPSSESEEAEPITKMILTLSTGDTSRDASSSLEKSGIIKSASEFENYLNRNQMAGKIQIGQHEVDSSMGFAELAKELTTVKQ